MTEKKPLWQLDAINPSEYHCCEATRGREFILRMNTGSDPCLAIEKFAREHNIRFGKVHASFMGAFKPAKYLVWAPDLKDPDNWHNEATAVSDNLTMLCSVAGMIGQRPTADGGEETFVAMHFVSGGAWDSATICGHLDEGTRILGCMEVFVTEILDIDVLKPLDEYGIEYNRPENWYQNTKNK